MTLTQYAFGPFFNISGKWSSLQRSFVQDAACSLLFALGGYDCTPLDSTAPRYIDAATVLVDISSSSDLFIAFSNISLHDRSQLVEVTPSAACLLSQEAISSQARSTAKAQNGCDGKAIRSRSSWFKDNTTCVGTENFILANALQLPGWPPQRSFQPSTKVRSCV